VIRRKMSGEESMMKRMRLMREKMGMKRKMKRTLMVGPLESLSLGKV
jgi:hypothetical protein